MTTYNNINQKVILVTGGTGSIGSEIVCQLAKQNPKVIKVLGRSEYKHFLLQRKLVALAPNLKIQSIIGDVRNLSTLMDASENVDIVFHAAGMKHIDYCEQYPEEAIQTNIIGALNVIKSAIHHKVKQVVMVSSDKAVNPNTLMGTTKLVMEHLAIGNDQLKNGHPHTQFAIVRFGNVLGSSGSVFEIWKDQVHLNQPITVTDPNMRRYFMSIPAAAELVLLATKLMHDREIFVLKMPEHKIIDLAHELIQRHHSQSKVIITGSQTREKMKEELFTPEEKECLIETDDFYIILPDKQAVNKRKAMYDNHKQQ